MRRRGRARACVAVVFAMVTASMVSSLHRAQGDEVVVAPTHESLARFAREAVVVVQNEAPAEAATYAGDEVPAAIYARETAVIVGEERCEAFRRTTSEGRRPAAAGLFNTGTNLLWKLLHKNCAMPRECASFARRRRMHDESVAYEARRGTGECSPFLTQVPWGKHNPVSWRGSHYAEMMRRVNVSEVLPVAVVKDPLTWFASMCRMEYAAKFRHGQAQCCPSPLNRTQTQVRWRKERPAQDYASIAHLWSQWNSAYLDYSGPRLVVRYEDLLWRTRETVSRVCVCAGGVPAAPSNFDVISSSAKGGAGHGFADTSRASATAKYSNETKRYQFLRDADLNYLNDHVDARLLDTFGYAATVDRRRQLYGDAPPCRPSRTAYLEALGLKPSARGPVPIDDQSDGVLANGVFYRNPNKKILPFSIRNYNNAKHHPPR
ncbi:hypothetical protein CTAYLR_009706 [Chrysophaeum taylorii]|uniref:Sulfotransferase n=1 Tax=Chrysophaeum taylorii TaxID=2483200 RepID=A0AAD7U905_9STRA|nr:hypothetical protein CTAYLR_009706 [Chrysophaeum taylorii]